MELDFLTNTLANPLLASSTARKHRSDKFLGMIWSSTFDMPSVRVQSRALWGCFRTAHAKSGHSANYYNYYVVYPGNTPENHPPAERCMINSKQHGVQNSGPSDPWQALD